VNNASVAAVDSCQAFISEQCSQQWTIRKHDIDWYTGSRWVVSCIWYREERPIQQVCTQQIFLTESTAREPTHQLPVYQLHITQYGISGVFS